jgi:hypothetical protein
MLSSAGLLFGGYEKVKWSPFQIRFIACFNTLRTRLRVMGIIVAGLSPPQPGFAPGSIHVGFVVDNMAMR